MATCAFLGLPLQFKTCELFGTALYRSNYAPVMQSATMKPLVIEARANTRTDSAKIRNRRLRKKFNGTSLKPRLSVFCSDKQLYAMLVDDQGKKCLFCASTLQKSIRKDPSCSTIEAAERVGEELVKACIDLDINEISSYDCNGLARGERMQAFEIAISRHGFLPRLKEELASKSTMHHHKGIPHLADLPSSANGGGGRKRRIVANGVQKTLSKTSMLVNFLPTGTLLTFEMVLPSVYGKGECSRVTTLMIHSLLGLCALSCFFHFTDSFRGPDGKFYYGFVTPEGLTVFKHGLGVEVPKDDKYKVGFTDFVHAFMSMLVFVAIAFSDHRVTDCLFPRHAKEMDEVMRSFPLMVGVICSGLFLVCPTTRYGIGCMAA